MSARKGCPTLDSMKDMKETELTKLANSKDSMVHLFSLIQQLIISNKAIANQQQKIQELETTISDQQSSITDLQERLLKSEQYSSRSTAIITGLEEKTGEDLEKIVTKIFVETGEVPPSFSSRDIAHVHRNRKKPDSTKPRSITIVFSRSMDKDRLFQKKVKDKLFSTHKIKLHHHMGQAMIAEQKKMEEMPSVEWVSYFGHAAGFRVKLTSGEYLKKVTTAADLAKKMDEL